jgi:hypothetical protein
LPKTSINALSSTLCPSSCAIHRSNTSASVTTPKAPQVAPHSQRIAVYVDQIRQDLLRQSRNPYGVALPIHIAQMTQVFNQRKGAEARPDGAISTADPLRASGDERGHFVETTRGIR